MNVAIIGTGKWAQVLHRTVEEMGHTAHSMNPRKLASDYAILRGADAVLFAVPPHIQAQLAPAYIDAGIPCFLEKPLACSEDGVRPIHWATGGSRGMPPVPPVVACDHLRTMAPSWRLFVASQREIAKSISIIVGGPGPERDWPVKSTALWDYGPHALAYLLDFLHGPKEFTLGEVIKAPGPGAVSFSFRYGDIRLGAITVSNRTPNGKVAKVMVNERITYDYDADAERPLQATLQAFFDAVEGKAPLPPQLGLARGIEIVKILEQVEARLPSGQ